MKIFFLLLVGILLTASAQAQNECWFSDRSYQVGTDPKAARRSSNDEFYVARFIVYVDGKECAEAGSLDAASKFMSKLVAAKVCPADAYATMTLGMDNEPVNKDDMSVRALSSRMPSQSREWLRRTRWVGR